MCSKADVRFLISLQSIDLKFSDDKFSKGFTLLDP
jgi:hypothetical protein